MKVFRTIMLFLSGKMNREKRDIADDEETKYTVRYTDGVDEEVIFADQVYGNLLSGVDTPAFKGTPKREGYVFKGWKPAVAEKVTGDVTYVAVWEKAKDNNGDTKPGDTKPAIQSQEIPSREIQSQIQQRIAAPRLERLPGVRRPAIQQILLCGWLCWLSVAAQWL